jgi:hypothetical protein
VKPVERIRQFIDDLTNEGVMFGDERIHFHFHIHLESTTDAPPPIPSLPPVEETSPTFTREMSKRVNARKTRSANKVGKPIMYLPKFSERLQFQAGDIVTLVDHKIIADGGGVYYECFYHRGQYVRAEDLPQ